MFDRVVMLSGFALGVSVLVLSFLFLKQKPVTHDVVALETISPLEKQVATEQELDKPESTPTVLSMEDSPDLPNSSIRVPEPSSVGAIGGVDFQISSPLPSPQVTPAPTPPLFPDPTPHPDLIKKVIPSPVSPIENPIILPPRLPLETSPTEGINPPQSLD